MSSGKLNVIFLLIYVHVLIHLCWALNTHVVPCDKTYTAKNGHLCYPCSPGFYFVSNCTKDREQAKCAKCPSGQYQPDCTLAQKCAPCTHVCPPKQVMVKKCDFTSNAVCRCEIGRYFKPEMGKPDEGVCMLHSLCDVGTGLVAKGTPFNDTKCIPCENGNTYSDIKSLEECQPCKSCDNFKSHCSPSSNAICGNPSLASDVKGIGTGVLVAVIVCSVAAPGIVLLLVCLCRRWKLCHLQTNTSSTSQTGASTESSQPAFSKPHEYVNQVGDKTNENELISFDGYATLHTDRSADTLNLEERYTNETSVTGPHLDNQACCDSLETCCSLDAEPVMPRESTEKPQKTLAPHLHADKVSDTTASCTPTLTERQSKSTLTERQSEHAWQIVTDVMTSMKWTDFLRAFRRLAVETNEEYFKTIDAEIDHELFAQRNNIKECIYQLIKRYRQTTPSATWQDVNSAMIKCSFTSESENLLVRIKSSNIIKTNHVNESGRGTTCTSTEKSIRYMRSNQTNALNNIAMHELKEYHV